MNYWYRNGFIDFYYWSRFNWSGSWGGVDFYFIFQFTKTKFKRHPWLTQFPSINFLPKTILGNWNDIFMSQLIDNQFYIFAPAQTACESIESIEHCCQIAAIKCCVVCASILRPVERNKNNLNLKHFCSELLLHWLQASRLWRRNDCELES